jgi:hypothetical protein
MFFSQIPSWLNPSYHCSDAIESTSWISLCEKQPHHTHLYLSLIREEYRIGAQVLLAESLHC